MKSGHQLEDEAKMLKQSAVTSLFKEIQNARPHFQRPEEEENRVYS